MKRLIYILLSLVSLTSFAQERDQMIKDTTRYYHFMNGENAYKGKDYKGAEQAYLLSDSVEHSFESVFNVGNALFMQDSTKDAVTTFENALTLAKDKSDKARVHHNVGNCYLKDKEYQKSIEAFKSALRNDPTNEETRYNLAYAKKMLENQQQEGGGEGQEQKDDEQKNDENKDNKDKKDDNKEDKDNKDEQKNDDKGDKEKEDEEKGEDKKDEKPEPSEEEQNKQKEEEQQAKAAAEKMLDALDQEEKDKREGMRLKEEKGKPKQIEKDW